MAVSVTDILAEVRRSSAAHEKRKSDAVTKPAPDFGNSLAAGVQSKVDRIAKTLLPYVETIKPCALGFAELGWNSATSLWLTVSVASALGAALGESFHILVSDGVRLKQQTPRLPADLSRCCPSVEMVGRPGSKGGLEEGDLGERLAELTAAGRKVLVHLSDAEQWIDAAEGYERLNGLVMLARASHTRKAAIDDFQHRLRQLEIPLLGAVLLDRVNPVPKFLDRLL